MWHYVCACVCVYQVRVAGGNDEVGMYEAVCVSVSAVSSFWLMIFLRQ